MVAIVDREGCIGCTLCTGVCPEVFQMEDGLAQGGPVPTGLESAAADAADAARCRSSGWSNPENGTKSGAVPDGERRRI